MDLLNNSNNFHSRKWINFTATERSYWLPMLTAKSNFSSIKRLWKADGIICSIIIQWMADNHKVKMAKIRREGCAKMYAKCMLQILVRLHCKLHIVVALYWNKVVERSQQTYHTFGKCMLKVCTKYLHCNFHILALHWNKVVEMYQQTYHSYGKCMLQILVRIHSKFHILASYWNKVVEMYHQTYHTYENVC